MFSQCFSDSCAVSVPQVYHSGFFPMDYITIEFEGIINLIRRLKLSSACGTDEINAKFLKNTEVYCSIVLSHIFKQSLQCGTLPTDWKVGKVIPVFKSGNQHSPLNYRPISLTSIPCKMLEHIIYSNLMAFLETNAFFSKFQHGFRKHHSCETQLLSFTHDVISALDNKILVDCIFLDFAKAFDKVSHQLLLLKLSTLNIDPNTLKWIECFLTNRTQYVTANNCSSNPCAVRSGVPQGSVLGPLLFLVYINDLASNIKSSIKLFADDCVLYRRITNEDDNLLLQGDLNRVSDWCNTWLMNLNVTKCKSMTITRSSITPKLFDYTLNGTRLEQVSSYKYLGVYITNDLSWHSHITYIINNANRSLGYLRRNFRQAPSHLKLQLYQTIVRPKLEYASAIWDPNQSTLIEALEAVQNRSARFIHNNYARTASVTLMKSTLQLPDLVTRRTIFRLSLFHKIFFHNQVLREELISGPAYLSSRVDHPNKVAIPFCRTNHFLQSFLPKTSRDWNRLPPSIAATKDQGLFKSAVSRHIMV